MVDKVEQETLRMRAKGLSPTISISRGDFTFLEGKKATAAMLNNAPKFGTVIYGAANPHTTFQPVTRSITTPGLNNQLPPVAPIVPRGTK